MTRDHADKGQMKLTLQWAHEIARDAEDKVRSTTLRRSRRARHIPWPQRKLLIRIAAWWRYASAVLRRLSTLDVLCLGTFFAGHHFEDYFFAFPQDLEALSHDGGMMHKNILPAILGYEAQALFIVPPFDFAFSHTCSPEPKAIRTAVKQ
jgi:hypothetical protein